MWWGGGAETTLHSYNTQVINTLTLQLVKGQKVNKFVLLTHMIVRILEGQL